MKPIRFSNILGQSRTLRSFRLALAAPAMVLTIATANAGAPTAPTAPSDPVLADNWISVSVGGAFVKDNDAGMMRRTQTNGDFYGGIDSMRFTQKLDKDTTMTIDGHAMQGLHDYDVNVDLTKDKVGFIKAGFKEYRTWYDASGGFLAGQQYRNLGDDDELHLDRGEASFQAGLRMENIPEITFTYKHAYRNGQKDSATWGEGIASGVTNLYKTMPAYWDIDEKSDTFRLDIEHTLGLTELGAGMTYEHASYSNTRTNTRGYNTTVTSPPTTNDSSFRTVNQTDNWSMDLFAGNIHSVTRFNDQLWVSAAVAYNTVNTNTEGGSRSFDYPYSVTKSSRGGDAFYRDMTGGGEIQQVIGNVNVMWAPMPDLTITPSLRYEHEEQSMWNMINSYTIVTPPTSSYPAYGADSEMDATTGAVDVRYAGIADWVFYAKGQWGREQETLMRRDLVYSGDWFQTQDAIDESEYSAGANWYPISGLSFAAQGIHAERYQGFDHTVSNMPGGSGQTLRPIMLEHDTKIHDLNLRMTWRPFSNLSMCTRYDYRQVEFDNEGTNWSPGTGVGTPGSSNILRKIESGDSDMNIISEAITWNPMARLYLQASFSYVMAKTVVNQLDTPNVDNDYCTGSLTAGYAIDDKTDLTGCYTYYGASNYTAGMYSMGYGLNTQENGITLTLRRMITDNVTWNLRYGYINSNTDPTPDQSGSFNDFSAHMISTGMQVRF